MKLVRDELEPAYSKIIPDVDNSSTMAMESSSKSLMSYEDEIKANNGMTP